MIPSQVDLFDKQYPSRGLILFDGDCALCNNYIRFILANEKNTNLMFSSLQSPLGQLVLKENQLDHTNLSTIIFIQEKKIYLKSDAILCIASHLCNPYSFTGQALGYIPAFIRNIIYDLVAKYRLYINKWSRLNQVCSMPDPAVSSRILLSPLYPL